ncbi:hypothetical protein [Rhabdothermincola salaria]|uniref:hypothetical protein n=1 Tax=Rhabdothermincola salaria TaxID=2903142 RepID=UPI001E6531D5|nr:hypothetical protein [Rhabdothermincola salaria]MCD9625219.1 hypothetical protein [Rhabdothermincola salaria]
MRVAIISGVGLGAVGAVVGLVLGLMANPPTAWFAVFELGVPSAVLGAVLGCVVGGAVSGVRRLRRASNRCDASRPAR